MTVRNFHYLVILPAILLLASCEAPRNNPFDPEADNYIGEIPIGGALSGKVTNRSFDPIEGALILTIPADGGVSTELGYWAASTDDQGNYYIDNIKPGDYSVVCSHPDFVSDTLSRSISINSTAEASFRLNSLPIFIDFFITSHFIYHGSSGIPPEEYLLHAHAIVNDPDGVNDIDSVIVKATEGNIYYQLTYSPDSSTQNATVYYDDILEAEFPGADIDSIKWNHFYCEVMDKSGGVVSSPIQTFARILDSYPIPKSPIDDQIVPSETLTLIWEPYEEQFFFTYTAVIYEALTDGAVWDSSGIPSIIDTVVVGDILTTTSYYWRLYVYDEYGNSSISEEADFQIQ